jgi:hypothetical protein
MAVDGSKTAARNSDVVTAVVSRFFDVVPRSFETHCVFSSHIIAAALERLGTPSQIVPCQVVCGSGDRTLMIGFVDAAPSPGKWDGHVAVRSGDILIDCATSLFRSSFGLEVPSAIATDCLTMPSNLIAKLTTGKLRFGWLVPPQGAKVALPLPPQVQIDHFATLLAERFHKQLACV